MMVIAIADVAAVEAPIDRNARVYCQRSFELAELRVDTAKDDPVIEGHAAVFGQWAQIGGGDWGFRESIVPGAFKKTIREADVRALINHNPDWVLGRNKAGTLTMREDDQGLHVVIHPPRTSWADDLMESMRRGDINQMSIGFEIVKQQWTEKKDEMDERTIQEVKLWDVSVVTFPAYPQTDAYVRSAINALQRYLPPEPDAVTHHSDRPECEPSPPAHSLDYYRARLLIIENGID